METSLPVSMLLFRLGLMLPQILLYTTMLSVELYVPIIHIVYDRVLVDYSSQHAMCIARLLVQYWYWSADTWFERGGHIFEQSLGVLCITGRRLWRPVKSLLAVYSHIL